MLYLRYKFFLFRHDLLPTCLTRPACLPLAVASALSTSCGCGWHSVFGHELVVPSLHQMQPDVVMELMATLQVCIQHLPTWLCLFVQTRLGEGESVHSRGSGLVD